MPAQAFPRQPPLSFGPFAFDTQSRILSRSGQELPVPPRVLGVLELLLERAGDVVPRQELIETVWKDAFVTDTSLAEAVSQLRQVLGDDPQSPTYVQTLHRRGYRFVAPVMPQPAAPAADRVVASPVLPVSPVGPVRPVSDDVRVSPSIGRELVPWSVAAICALIAIAAVWQYTRRAPASLPVAARFAIQLPSGSSFDDRAPALAASSDGSVLAWSACDQAGCRIYTRELDQIDPVPVGGTEDGRAPFFSPDGRWLGFFANGRLVKVALAGGAAVTIADAPSTLGAVWIDREIVFAGSPTGGLMRVPADGGEPRPLTIPREADGEVRHTWPARVPGTSVLLFTIDRTLATDAPGLPGTLAALSLDAREAPRTSQWRTLLDNVSLARAFGPDAIVFARESELHAVAFDPARLALAGPPRVIRGQLATARGRAHFALSDAGSLVHAVAPDRDSRTLVFFQPPSGVDGPPRQNLTMREAAISPDGSRVAGVNLEGPGAGIWISDRQRVNATRLVHKDSNASPVWSADGRSIFFASRTNGVFEIWRREVDGARPATRVFASDRHAFPLAASPDGKRLAFLQSTDSTRADIWQLPLTGGAPQLIVQSPFDEVAASFSPDSELLAFQSAETGRWEIYVQRLRDGRRLLVSTNGGEKPVWTRDGLHYQSGRTVIRKTVINEGDLLRIDDVLARDVMLDRRTTIQSVAPDGQLLVIRGSDPPPSSAIVSLEWRREVREMLGPPASALPR
jgi:DNA-binding winged helix-turn-helix (wHTH) protein/Tol biopolymer transport system component